MVELPKLGRHRTLIALPEGQTSELVSLCELLCQEGYTTWSVRPDQVETAVELMQVFARRARFGVHDVADAATVRRVAKAGAEFVSTRLLLPKLVKAVADFPVILGGATPTELVAGLDAGAAAVQLWPADGYTQRGAAALVPLLGGRPVIAAGELDPEAATEWLRAGAGGVWPVGLSDALAAGDGLTDVRDLLHWWRPAL